MENDMLIYGDLLFDNLDELLDFSKEEESQMLTAVEAPTATTVIPSCLFPCPDAAADLSAAPAEMGAVSGASHDAFFCDDLDVAEMEWLSNFVEESFSPAGIANISNGTVTSTVTNSGSSNIRMDQEDTNNTNNNGYHLHHHLDMLSVGSNIGNQDDDDLLYLASSPLSVLEHGILINSGMSSSSSSMSSPTSSSCSGVLGDLNPAPLCSTERNRAPRTKRTRPLAFPHIAEDPTNDSGEDPAPKKMKKLKIKISQPAPIIAASAAAITNGGCEGEVRKCLHCGLQKTPQWRLGPMGPKTLCNACGVRYKSGRLFPEYRPAASPTFVASVHSNSHKKVVEMRMSKTGVEEEEEATEKKKQQVSSKCCELLNYIRGSKKDWGAQEGRKDRGGLVA